MCETLIRLKIVLALLFLISFGAMHEVYAVQSCQCVAFRMDDIQDYWLDDVQIGTISEFQHKDVNLTAGIIGNYFGHDQKIVGFISNSLKSDSPKLVVANHGWNHEHFETFSRDEQSALIHNTNQKILDTLGILPNIFIAPYNTINNDTVISLLENNMVYLSANDTQDKSPYKLSDTSFFRLPSTAKIGDVSKGGTTWTSYGHDVTYAQVLASLVKYGFAVVLLHPQDYANKHSGFAYDNVINQTQIHELDLLIDEIRNDGYKLVSLDDIPKNAHYETKYPKWLDKDFEWFAKGEITDSEIINSVKYLQNIQTIQTGLVSAKYPLHENIRTTYFWIGESADSDNQYISNLSSAWDENWVHHYGGVDDPKNRDNYMPSAFTPKENPFYFALPYNDFNDDGTRKTDAYSTVYWAGEKQWNDSQSMLKNRWIEITKDNKTAYAQWEDTGPFVYNDSNYVFGDAQPSNDVNHDAGLDVSPAVKDYLSLLHGKNVVSWRFVNLNDVPDGPWKDVITTSQVFHFEH